MAEKIFDDIYNQMLNAEKDFPEDSSLNESDALGKGPDKSPEMKGKDPDLKNVNEDFDTKFNELKAQNPDLTDDEILDKFQDELHPVRRQNEEEMPMAEESDEDFKPQTPMERMEGLVDQRAVEAAGLAMTQVVGPLLKDGFDVEDVVEFLSSMALEAAENWAGQRDFDHATPGGEVDKEDELVVPEED